MGPNKFVHLTFAVGALLAAFVVSRMVDWGWSYFTKPNDLVVNLLAIVVAGGAAIATYRNERAYSSIVEVTRELEKVTWPARKETSAATIVVLVSLWPLRILAHRLFERIRPGELRLEVELRANESPSVLLESLETRGVAVRAFEVEDARDRRRVALEVRVEDAQPETVTAELMRLEPVLGVRWAN